MTAQESFSEDSSKFFLSTLRKTFDTQKLSYELKEEHPEIIQVFIELTSRYPVRYKREMAAVTFYLCNLLSEEMVAGRLEELLQLPPFSDGDDGEDLLP